MSESTPASDRNETEDERADRKWNELLQELRVMQTGAQLTAGFLLTLPFQSSFDSLDSFLKGLYLALVMLAAITTALVLGPVAVHRRLTGQHVKERVVDSAHRIVYGVLACLSLLVTGMVLLVFDMVTSRGYAIAAAAVIAAILLVLQIVLPNRLVDRAAA